MSETHIQSQQYMLSVRERRRRTSRIISRWYTNGELKNDMKFRSKL